MLNGKSNMRQSDLKSTLELCTLKEAILAKHGPQGPETFRRNNSKTPIDGMKDMAIKLADCMRTGHILKEDACLAFYRNL
jgi:hypothetical protein